MGSNRQRKGRELETFFSELEKASGRASVILSKRDYLSGSGEEDEDEENKGNTYSRKSQNKQN
jgi:hypothetical protein